MAGRKLAGEKGERNLAGGIIGSWNGGKGVLGNCWKGEWEGGT